jgi:hypothetical protein
MAKVRGAFGGFGTTQQIGKAYVFFIWKGINAIRTWVIPANPNTGAQQAQRGNFTLLVAIWHSGLLLVRDIVAWERSAGTVKYRPQSGFNRFIGVFRSLFYAGMSGTHLTNATDLATGAAVWQTRMSADDWAATNACTKFWGTSPTSMWHTDTPIYAIGDWTSSVINTGLPVGAKVYWRYRIVDGVAMQEGESGINVTILT